MTQKDLFTKQSDRHRVCENRLVIARGRGSAEGMEWECGVSRCKLVYGRWINSNVLLYSTANYIQYPVINHSGKEYAKECIYMYDRLTLLYSRNEHNCKSTIAP